MQDYETILVAVDVFSDYQPIIERAMKVAGNPVKITLLYVAHPQTNFEPYGLFLERDFSEEIREQAKIKLESIAHANGIPKLHVHVEIGAAAEEIRHAADKIGADLIVLGTHGTSGIQLIMGSTCSSVLHGIKSDLLAVRVSD